LEDWSKVIDLAEQLLIHTHGPACNMMQMQAAAEMDQMSAGHDY
jgi:hypothetical protein